MVIPVLIRIACNQNRGSGSLLRSFGRKLQAGVNRTRSDCTREQEDDCNRSKDYRCETCDLIREIQKADNDRNQRSNDSIGTSHILFHGVAPVLVNMIGFVNEVSPDKMQQTEKGSAIWRREKKQMQGRLKSASKLQKLTELGSHFLRESWAGLMLVE